MKKFLVLFLLVSLVPFTVGCRLFDKGDDVSDPTTTLRLSAVVPAGEFVPSIRAAAVYLRYSEMFMELKESGRTIRLNYESHEAIPEGVRINFAAAVASSRFNSLKGKATFYSVKLQPAGLTEPVVVVDSTAYTVPSKIVAGTAPDAHIPPAENVKTAEVEDAITAIDRNATFPKFKVTDVLHGTTELSTVKASPTEVSSAASYTFVVKADKSYANTSVPTWKVRVANVKDGGRFVITTVDVDYATVTYNAAKTEATIVVTPAAGTPLTEGETYSIVLQETNAVDADGTALTLPKACYIKVVEDQ